MRMFVGLKVPTMPSGFFFFFFFLGGGGGGGGGGHTKVWAHEGWVGERGRMYFVLVAVIKK